MRRYQFWVVVGVLLVVAGMSLLLQSQVLAQEATPEATPEPYQGFGAPLEGNPPYLADYYNAWVSSPHADTTAEAFNDWNSEGAVPESCARCHSTPGFIDFVGGDGSEAGKVDAKAPIGTVLTCDGCHNSAAVQVATVSFPSGAEVTDVGRSGRCMECHQGRASTDTVNAAIEKAGLTDDMNKVSADLGFVNIHYFAAAATLFGGDVRGGYQYDGKFYQGRNQHVPGYTTCANCHKLHGRGTEVGPDLTGAERKNLTVLFSDLAGSTPLSEKLDPEDLREILGDYQTVCTSVVKRYDGYVAKFLGDGVLAYFGYPEAHEDDARRFRGGR